MRAFHRGGETRCVSLPARNGNSFPLTGKIFPPGRWSECCFRTLTGTGKGAPMAWVACQFPPYTPRKLPLRHLPVRLARIKRDRRKPRLVRGIGPVPGFRCQPGKGAAGLAGMAGEGAGVQRTPHTSDQPFGPPLLPRKLKGVRCATPVMSGFP